MRLCIIWPNFYLYFFQPIHTEFQMRAGVKSHIKFTYARIVCRTTAFLNCGETREGGNRQETGTQANGEQEKDFIARIKEKRLGPTRCTVAIQRNHRQLLWHSFGFSLTLFLLLFLLANDAHISIHNICTCTYTWRRKKPKQKFMRDMSFNETVISRLQSDQMLNRTETQHNKNNK